MENNKQEQIEEIAKYICNACEMGFNIDGDCAQGNNYKTCGISKETAEYIYNAGYRKVPENEVVFTKEEYKKIEIEKKQLVKEFAEKLKKRTILYSGINVKYEAITADIIDELLKEYEK